ncbi:HBL/NHE enterotoxin family protein [Bacillus carboniphilus]|uniref:HBL/NHE enterotoxin family protein n=1 Tax=Bacillus carboniphilus TaxID=86663 RepID=A0ABY9JTZ8_9BACI|nr:HBL/NHE enterotoxin family protein [Bacillus carboniphilus]WLR41161.1 HBL/NHE enterotoxin family protein [Bacillus carboniphilus]
MKVTKKIMISSALATALSMNTIIPMNVLATERVETTTTNQTIAENYLGPDGLKQAMEDTASNALVMDAYALTILKQEDIFFKNIESLEINDLSANLTSHQQTARNNAAYWLDTLKPSLIQVNENIIGYNTKFQNYYDTLVSLAKANDKETLNFGLELLHSEIEENKEEVDALIEDLTTFKHSLFTDVQSFRSDSNDITALLSGNNALIPQLKDQISAYNDAINTDIAIIAGGAAGEVVGVAMFAGGVILFPTAPYLGGGLMVAGVAVVGGSTAAIIIASNDLQSKQQALKDATTNLTQLETEVVVLETLNNQVNYFVETIDIAIESLKNISDQWNTLSSKYNTLIDTVEDTSGDLGIFVIPQLNTAKDDWEDIKTYAETLYQDLNYNTTIIE